MPTTSETYDRKYGSGKGWRYTEGSEGSNVDRVVKAAGWSLGHRVLEIGCGEGFHARALAKRGLNVTAIDISRIGIINAQKKYGGVPNLEYVSGDLESWAPIERELDGIFCRGMSWYHYEMDERSPHNVIENTKRLFGWLKKGGTFVLQVATHFTGSRPKNDIHNNRVPDYVGLFERFGTVEYVADFRGNILPRVKEAKGYSGITISTRK